MVCYKCRFEYDKSIFSEMEKVALAFFPSDVVSSEQWRNPVWGDKEFSTQFGQYLFDQLRADEGFISRYREMQRAVYQAKPNCPNCGETLYNDNLSHIESSVYYGLVERELDFMVGEFVKIHDKDPSSLLANFETTWKKIYFLLENADVFYPGQEEYIRAVHDFIRSLEHPGRGGDGNWSIIQWAYDFATNEFVKSAIYDLIKLGASSLMAYFIARHQLMKVQSKTTEKIEENFEASLDRTDEYSTSRMLKYLTKKERKALSKKLGKRIAKQQFRKIRKRKR